MSVIETSAVENMAPSTLLRRYVLGILLVVYTFNFIDRQILSILLEPNEQPRSKLRGISEQRELMVRM